MPLDQSRQGDMGRWIAWTGMTPEQLCQIEAEYPVMFRSMVREVSMRRQRDIYQSSKDFQ